ncbi:MAG TPA: response regulator transcription factor [Terriglobales bacterium]|nr:response regulator transcription factor [Terriglobales bacterium]
MGDFGPKVDAISVLVADSSHMQTQLLVAALRRRPEFRVHYCLLESEAILAAIEQHEPNVVVIAAERDLSSIRSVHLSYPEIPKVLLTGNADRSTVVNAFRAGVRGLFCFADLPFRLLCRCIQCVHEGQVWVSNGQLEHLIETITHVPSLRVINSNGHNLLTRREEQVVALVADGLSNRDVAHELGLSEHTVKKYLYRIFDKVGVSSRVELVLYAVTRGAVRNAEWVPA